LDEAQLLHLWQCTVARVFALTFDDGPGPSTAALLDVLQAHGVRATFFLLGRNVVEAPWGDPAAARAVAVRAAREGHVLGNHTYSHFRPGRWRDLRKDLLRGAEVVREVLHEAGAAPEVRMPFRLPYGIRLIESTLPSPSGTVNAATIDPRLPVIASLGLAHQHWTSDFDDWTMTKGDGPKLAAAMVAHVLQVEALGLDAVMDLHDSGTGSTSGYERPATIEGVRLFLEEARRRNWPHFTVP
jgi:peptidoglycan/xylan/chitin deacetylase (PgdA/CDA1 family)